MNKGKGTILLLLTIISLLGLSTIVTAEWVYYENATSYSYTGDWYSDATDCYDGDWGTDCSIYSGGGFYAGYLYINYTWDNNTYNNVQWHIKDSEVNQNYSIPNVCMDYANQNGVIRFNVEVIAMEEEEPEPFMEESTYWMCFTGSVWTPVQETVCIGCLFPYEEGLWLNTTESTEPSVYDVNITNQPLYTNKDAVGSYVFNMGGNDLSYFNWFVNDYVVSAGRFAVNYDYTLPVNISTVSGSTNQNYTIDLILNSTNVGANWNWSHECVDDNSTRIAVLNADMEEIFSWGFKDCSASSERLHIVVKILDNITTTDQTILYIAYGSDSVSSSVGDVSEAYLVYDSFDSPSYFEDHWYEWGSFCNYPPVRVSGNGEWNGRPSNGLGGITWKTQLPPVQLDVNVSLWMANSFWSGDWYDSAFITFEANDSSITSWPYANDLEAYQLQLRNTVGDANMDIAKINVLNGSGVTNLSYVSGVGILGGSQPATINYYTNRTITFDKYLGSMTATDYVGSVTDGGYFMIYLGVGAFGRIFHVEARQLFNDTIMTKYGAEGSGVLLNNGEPPYLNSGNYSKGDKIILQIIPNNGGSNGSSVNSSAVTVADLALTLPNVTLFDGRTTNFSIEPDIESVDFPVLEKTVYGMIEWLGTGLNCSAQNFDAYVTMGNGWISVDGDNLNADFDSPANLTFYTSSGNVPAIYSSDGVVCNDCNFISYDDIFIGDYQEDANITLGVEWINVENAYDGDWNTYAEINSSGIRFFQYNPPESYVDVIWQVKLATPVNYTLSDYCVFPESGTLNLAVYSDDGVNYDLMCSDYEGGFHIILGGQTDYFYEESVFWVTATPTNAIVVFNVSHFTNFINYSIGINSNLVVWDQNDSGVPFGGQTASAGEQIKFFADYTNVTSGMVVTGATCNILFNDSASALMSYNSSGFYDYNRTFTAGDYSWNVTCDASGYDAFSASDSIHVVASFNNPPTATPYFLNSPYENENLIANGGYSDEDNDPESGSLYRWYVNDVEVVSGTTDGGNVILTSGNYTAGDEVVFSYNAHDGMDWSGFVNASLIIQGYADSDLAVIDVGLSEYAINLNETVYINATVKNIGYNVSTPTTIRFSDDPFEGSAVSIVNISLPALEPGESFEIENFAYTPLGSGERLISASIDAANEHILTNNKMTRFLTVGGDIAQSNIILNTQVPSSAYPGDNIYVWGTAEYNTTFGSGVAAKGSLVTLKIGELILSTSTDSTGKFGQVLKVPANLSYGNNTLESNITDFTLAGYDSDIIDVKERPEPLHGPDLTLYPGDVWSEPYAPLVTDDITIFATIRNIGDIAGSSTIVSFYDNGVIIGTKNIGSIPADGSLSINISWPSPSEGWHNIYVTIAAVENETDTANNALNKAVKVFALDVDFVPVDIYLSESVPPANESVVIYALVSNEGGLSNETNVDFYVDGDFIGSSSEVTVPGKGGTYQFSQSYTFQDEGNHQVLVAVDPSDQVSESNELNNNRTEGFLIGEAIQKADLVINSEDIQFSDENPSVDETITVFVNVTNSGQVNASSFIVRISEEFEYYSADINNVTVDSLAVMETKTVNVSYTPTASGTHIIGAQADASDVITELNEQNNDATRALNVGTIGCDSSTVAYWKFDETSGSVAEDFASDNDGNVSGASWVSGMVGGALEFDGSGDFVDVVDVDQFSFGNGAADSAFTVSAWVFMHDRSNFVIVSKDSYPDDREWDIRTVGDGYLHFYAIDDSEGMTWVGRKDSAQLQTNTWYHVVGTYDGSGTNDGFRIYVDGVRVDDVDYSGGSYVAMENTPSDLQIGKQATLYSDGLIDEVAVYARNISQTEVEQHYNATAGDATYCELA